VRLCLDCAVNGLLLERVDGDRGDLRMVAMVVCGGDFWDFVCRCLIASLHCKQRRKSGCETWPGIACYGL